MRDLRAIMIFREVVRAGGFSRAARQLNVTPAAVSRSIARLEAELHARLFNRTTSEFHLTPEGAALSDAIGLSLDRLEGALEDFGGGRSAPSGKLRVSLTTSYGKHYVLPRLPQFLAAYPDIRLEIDFDDSRTNLVASGFDIGTCYGPPLLPSYVSRVVCRPELLLVASPAYLASHGVPRRPEDLSGLGAIIVRMASDIPIPWEFLPRERHPADRSLPFVHQPSPALVIAGQLDAVTEAAVAGIGVTVAHSRAVLPYLREGRLKTLLPDFEVRPHLMSGDVYVFFPHRQHMASRVRAFVEFLAGDTPGPSFSAAEFAA